MGVKNTKKYLQLLDSLFKKEGSLSTKNKEDIEKVYQVFDFIIKDDEISKSDIANKIYSVEEKDTDGVCAFLLKSMDKYFSQKEIGNKEKKKIKKFVETIKLYVIQKSYLYDSQDEKLKSLEKELTSLEKMSENIENNSKKLEAKYNSMIVQFITILGIFSSIIFAVFGGFNEISSIGNVLFKLHIYKILIYIGTTGIVTLTIIFFSYYAISLLTGLNFIDNKDNVKDDKVKIFCFIYGVLFLIVVAGILIKCSNLC